MAEIDIIDEMCCTDRSEWGNNERVNLCTGQTPNIKLPTLQRNVNVPAHNKAVLSYTHVDIYKHVIHKSMNTIP